MDGSQVQDATKAHTWSQDTQDAQHANLMSLASGCKGYACDAT